MLVAERATNAVVVAGKHARHHVSVSATVASIPSRFSQICAKNRSLVHFFLRSSAT